MKETGVEKNFTTVRGATFRPHRVKQKAKRRKGWVDRSPKPPGSARRFRALSEETRTGNSDTTMAFAQSMLRRGLLAGLTAVVLLTAAVPAMAAKGARRYLKKPPEWFKSPEAKRVAANILSYQSDLGGWPKNIDTTAAPFTGNRRKLDPTFDNDATTDELRILARMYVATSDAQYRRAFERGLDYILKAQYPNGGWPQFYPPGRKYHRYITFNDDAMVRLLQLLQEIDRTNIYGFLDHERRTAARQAFDRGIECILACQIKIDGKPTVWCAQHDEKNLSPRPGRTYELASSSGAESVGIVRLLMSLEPPDPRVVQAVQGAVRWFEHVRILGIREEVRPDPRSPKGTNKVVVKGPAARPMWARFYELGTNRPIFADRDGVVKYDLSEIGYERRNGYAWLGYWPERLLQTEYPAWRRKWLQNATQTRDGLGSH
jgi:PelA/Pel-15E family pectate lyase